MRVKSFTEFLNEEEKVAPEDTSSEDKGSSEEKNDGHEKEDDQIDRDPKVKDQRIGYLANGDEVMSKMKVGHTIELSPEDFKKIGNMRITQYERDMYSHSRGGKDYKIKKNAEGKCTIFHYNKTLHELTPVGVFMLPKSE